MNDFSDSRPAFQQTAWDGVDRRSFTQTKQSPEPKGIKFDPTINAGHLLTFAGFVVAGFVAWTAMDKRVLVLEERATFQVQIDRAQDARHDTNMLAIKEVLADIKQQVNRVADRVERKPVN